MVRYTLKRFTDLAPEELYEIMKLRQEVFVVEQDCVYLDNDDLDQIAHHLLGFDSVGLCTYTRLLPPDTSYKNASSIGRVINHIRTRKLGEGKRLMQISIKRIKSIYPNHPVKISAQTYLQKFYEGLGFIKIGDEYLEDGIPHIPMKMD
jgi:ElaA protein